MSILPLERAYELARGEGVAVRRPRGLVRLTGPQRVWFLQNTVTADLDGVEEGRWAESFFLDLKGHVVAHFLAGILPDEVWLDVDPPATEALVDWMVRYRFRTKVEIEDRSSATGAWTVLGGAARDLAAAGAVTERPVFGGVLADVPVADLFDGEPAVEIAGEDLYEVLRIEAGVGRFGVDYGPANLPQEAGLTRVVSVSKGCYVGQEVMARIHFRGHANRTVRRLDLRGVGDVGELPGRELRRGDERAGTITSVAVSPSAGPIAIGMVRLVVDPGETLTIAGGGEAVAGPVPEGTKRT